MSFTTSRSVAVNACVYGVDPSLSTPSAPLSERWPIPAESIATIDPALGMRRGFLTAASSVA